MPPRIRSPDLLRRMLAWKLQEESYGGLDPETRRLLAKKATVDRGPKLGAGARLVREWKGERHEVEVNALARRLARSPAAAGMAQGSSVCGGRHERPH